MEVSHQALDLLFGVLEERAIPVASLLEGTGLDEAVLRGRGRLPWTDFLTLFERFEGLIGKDALFDAGASYVDMPLPRRLGGALNLLLAPSDLYSIGQRLVGTTLFAPLQVDVEARAQHHVRIVMTLQPPYHAPWGFFEVHRGILSRYPELVGMSPARVELREGGPGRFLFDVYLTPTQGLRARLGRLARWARGIFALHGLLDDVEAHAQDTLEAMVALRKVEQAIEQQRDELREKVQELELVQAELRRSDALYRSLTSSAQEQITVVDRAGIVLFTNHGVYRAPDQIVGQAVVDLVPECCRAEAAAGLRRALEEGAFVSMELTYPGGTVFVSNVSPIREDGEIRGATFVARDVTEQKRIERDRLELERRLLHAQKLESIGVLAGGIAHDFNNLLTGIQANAEMLERAPHGADDRDRLRRIRQASRRAADLTEQILAYSGRSGAAEKPVDAGHVMVQVADLLGVALPKGVRLRVATPAELPWVLADPSQFQQIIMNLATNAAEALDGPGCVELSAEVTALEDGEIVGEMGDPLPGGRYVHIRVRDEGRGIDPEVRPRIFEPFFTTRSGGRGLGLSTVAGILRGQRGTLVVDSAPGVGSTFSVLLPATDARGAAVVEVESTSHEGVVGSVLVVDDEPVVLETTSDILRAFGFEVVTAVDGASALDAFREQGAAVELALLDMTMPGMSGVELARELHTLAPDLPIVLCSAYDLGAAVASAPGVRGFVRKPYRPKELVEAVRRVLRSTSV